MSPVLRDEEGEIRDYPTLKKRIEKNPEHGVDLFLAPEFRDAFLYRDESGRILYDCLLNKTSKSGRISGGDEEKESHPL